MYKAVYLFKWIEFSFLFSIRSKSLTLLQSWSSAITVHYNNPEQICVANNRNSTLSPHESVSKGPVCTVCCLFGAMFKLHMVLFLLAEAMRMCEFIYQTVWMWGLGWREEYGCSQRKRADQNRPLGPFSMRSSSIFSQPVFVFCFF